MRKPFKVALWIVGGLILIGIVAPKPESQPSADAGEITKPAPGPTPSRKTEPKKDDLEFLGATAEYSEHSFTINGRVKNNTAKKYNYAQVVFQVYNKADEQVGTAMANVNGLEPGSVWKFKAVGLTGEGRTYKLDKVTGF